MDYRNSRHGIAMGMAVGAALMASALPMRAQESTLITEGADLSTMCGDKPVTVALVDGYGGNTWRNITFAELEDEASKCPNITRILHSVANGDQQKYNSDINSYVAQGVDIIIAMTDFGAAPIPAYRDAFEAGAIMVPYHADLTRLEGYLGEDYAANPYEDIEAVARNQADWLGRTVKSGNVVYLGGFPGAHSSSVMLEAFKDQLSNYPDITLLDQNFIVTNWSTADAQKAVAGLIAQYPQIDGIAGDGFYGALATVRIFQAAGLPIPAIATLTANNELNCKYTEIKDAGQGFKFYSHEGTSRGVRFALRAGIAAFTGSENPDHRAYLPVVMSDSEAGLDPLCDPTAPPDADLYSGLPEEKLEALLK